MNQDQHFAKEDSEKETSSNCTINKETIDLNKNKAKKAIIMVFILIIVLCILFILIFPQNMNKDVIERQIPLVEVQNKSIPKHTTGFKRNYVNKTKNKGKNESLSGPVRGNISKLFGKSHSGIDISAPYGTAIYAMQDGYVTRSGRRGSYGLTITIDSYYNDVPQVPRIQTMYGQCSVLYAKKGQFIRRGQIIALVGSTGKATKPHLHFEVIYQDKPVDPIDYLRKLPGYLNYVSKARAYRNNVKNKNQITYNYKPKYNKVYSNYAASSCDSGHWINSVENGGKIIKLEDGSIWEVNDTDTADSSLWLPVSDITACDDKLINTDEHENVEAKRIN